LVEFVTQSNKDKYSEKTIGGWLKMWIRRKRGNKMNSKKPLSDVMIPPSKVKHCKVKFGKKVKDGWKLL